MGLLHDKLEELKAEVGRAFNFAEPERFMAEAETKFKAAVADAFHGLETRIDAIEHDIVSLFSHAGVDISAVKAAVANAVIAPAQSDASPATVVDAQPVSPAPIATLTVIADNALAVDEHVDTTTAGTQ